MKINAFLKNTRILSTIFLSNLILTPGFTSEAVKNCSLGDSRLSYPEESRKRGETGTVKIRVSTDLDGTVNDLEIIETSGFSLLDISALEFYSKNVKCSQKTVFDIPVNFTLTAKDEDVRANTTEPSKRDEYNSLTLSNNWIDNWKFQIKEKTSCPKKYPTSSPEQTLLTSSISMLAINYCYEMTVAENLKYINKNQKQISSNWYGDIKKWSIEKNNRINIKEINQCAEYRVVDHQKIISVHFLGTLMPLLGAQSGQFNVQIAGYCKAFMSQLQIQRLELLKK